MTNRIENIRLTTPRGVAIYPWLNVPDTKFEPLGEYNAKLRLDASEPAVQAMIEKGYALRDAFYEQEVARLVAEKKVAQSRQLQKAESFALEYDDAGEETGFVTITAKMASQGTNKKTGEHFTQKPVIFNAQGLVLKNPPKIGGGSVLKLSVEIVPYHMASTKMVGVSFRLKGAQIIKLMSGGQRDASSFGFGAEEDGDEVFDTEFGAEDMAPANTDTPSEGSYSDDDDI